MVNSKQKLFMVHWFPTSVSFKNQWLSVQRVQNMVRETNVMSQKMFLISFFTKNAD